MTYKTLQCGNPMDNRWVPELKVIELSIKIGNESYYACRIGEVLYIATIYGDNKEVGRLVKAEDQMHYLCLRACQHRDIVASLEKLDPSNIPSNSWTV